MQPCSPSRASSCGARSSSIGRTRATRASTTSSRASRMPGARTSARSAGAYTRRALPSAVALRVLLLPGDRLRDLAQAADVRGRRAGRAQAFPRPDAGAGALGPLARAPEVRARRRAFPRARGRGHHALRQRTRRAQSIQGRLMPLKDKVAIVTGAGSGFFAGIAKRFAEEGARVVVNDIDARGERTARQIGGRFVQGDVTKSADWARLVREAGAELAIVVNNAGWTHRNKPYLEVSEEEFDRVYAVNVKSVYLSAIHAVPVFRRRGGGAFVNIASPAGLPPRPGLPVHNSSKGTVTQL